MNECVILFERVNVTWIVNLPDHVRVGDRGVFELEVENSGRRVGDDGRESFIVKDVSEVGNA